MKIYNIDKTKILNENELDLELGHLVTDTLVTHVPAKAGVSEQGHYETIKEYPNGGKDVEWVVDKEGVEPIKEHDESEEIQVYVPYTEQELVDIEKGKVQREIDMLKSTLASTDYKALKYAEGWISEEEYTEIREYRQELREQINEKEQELVELG